MIGQGLHRILLIAVLLLVHLEATRGNAFDLTCEGALGASSTSEEIWKNIDQPIMNSLNRILSITPKSGYFTYDKSSRHMRIAETVLGLELGIHTQKVSVADILNNYTEFMLDQVRQKKIEYDDLLLPGFVFRFADGSLHCLKHGSRLPEGAHYYSNIYPDYEYNQFLSDGCFPMGDHRITVSLIAVFQHDLAHLTGFIESPEYMARLKGMTRKIDLSILSANKRERVYFLNEGLFIVDEKKKAHLIEAMILSPKMKASPTEISIDQMTDYIKTLSWEEQSEAWTNLYKTIAEVVIPLGGASREPFSSGSLKNYYIYHSLLNYFFYFIIHPEDRILYSGAEPGLARLQYFLLRVKDLTLKDWFSAFQVNQIDETSTLYSIFKEDRLWQHTVKGDFRNSFLKP